MRSNAKRAIKLFLPLAMAFGLTGCVVYERPGPPPPPGVVYGPGYYYDAEYVDVYGYRHPPVYYYYDGHGWYHRDYVPHGYVAQVRVRVR